MLRITTAHAHMSVQCTENLAEARRCRKRVHDHTNHMSIASQPASLNMPAVCPLLQKQVTARITESCSNPRTSDCQGKGHKTCNLPNQNVCIIHILQRKAPRHLPPHSPKQEAGHCRCGTPCCSCFSGPVCTAQPLDVCIVVDTGDASPYSCNSITHGLSRPQETAARLPPA